MARAKSKEGLGKGWHKQPIRHRNARLYGRAGGIYKTKPATKRLQTILQKNPSYKNLNIKQLRNKGIFLKYTADTDKDGVKNIKDCQPLNPKKQDKKHQNIFLSTPYVSEVSFYAHPTNRKTIIVQEKYIGKGWYAVRIGNDIFKTRQPKHIINEQLSKKYPEYKKVSFFWTTSYSAGGKTGFGKYGLKDYTIDYIKKTKTGKTFFLQQPIKTETKKHFGKEINKINETITDYVVLDWKPEGKTEKLFIKHIRYTPFKEEIIYKSKEYPLKEKKKAIQDFRKYVSKIA